MALHPRAVEEHAVCRWTPSQALRWRLNPRRPWRWCLWGRNTQQAAAGAVSGERTWSEWFFRFCVAHIWKMIVLCSALYQFTAVQQCMTLMRGVTVRSGHMLDILNFLHSRRRRVTSREGPDRPAYRTVQVLSECPITGRQLHRWPLNRVFERTPSVSLYLSLCLNRSQTCTICTASTNIAFRNPVSTL